MKKVFFVFAVAAGIAMTACNNKPAGEATTTTDTTAVTTAVTTSTTDTTKTAVDTTAAKADTTAAKK